SASPHSLYHSFFSFHSFVPLRDLPSFPTRRSSDLHRWRNDRGRCHLAPGPGIVPLGARRRRQDGRGDRLLRAPELQSADRRRNRSEEHTSELQSPYDLVCRLLLEKKKKKKTTSSQS